MKRAKLLTYVGLAWPCCVLVAGADVASHTPVTAESEQPPYALRSTEDIPVGMFDWCALRNVPAWDAQHNQAGLVLEASCGMPGERSAFALAAVWETGGGFELADALLEFYYRQQRIKRALALLHNSRSQTGQVSQEYAIGLPEIRVNQALELLAKQTDLELGNTAGRRDDADDHAGAVVSTIRIRCEMEEVQRQREADTLGISGEERVAYMERGMSFPCHVSRERVKELVAELSKPKGDGDPLGRIADPYQFLVRHSKEYLARELRDRQRLASLARYRELMTPSRAPSRSWLESTPATNQLQKEAAAWLGLIVHQNRRGWEALQARLRGTEDPVLNQIGMNFLNGTGEFADQNLRAWTAASLMAGGVSLSSFELAGTLTLAGRLAGGGAQGARNLFLGITSGILLEESGAAEYVGTKFVNGITAVFGESVAAQYAGGIVANAVSGAIPLFLAGPRISTLLQLPRLGANSLRTRLAWSLVGGLGNNARMMVITGLNMAAETAEGGSFDPFSYERAKEFSMASAASGLYVLVGMASAHRLVSAGATLKQAAAQGAVFGVGLEGHDAYSSFKPALDHFINHESAELPLRTLALVLRTMAIALDADAVMAGALGGVASTPQESAEHSHIEIMLLDTVRLQAQLGDVDNATLRRRLQDPAGSLEIAQLLRAKPLQQSNVFLERLRQLEQLSPDMQAAAEGQWMICSAMARHPALAKNQRLQAVIRQEIARREAALGGDGASQQPKIDELTQGKLLGASYRSARELVRILIDNMHDIGLTFDEILALNQLVRETPQVLAHVGSYGGSVHSATLPPQGTISGWAMLAQFANRHRPLAQELGIEVQQDQLFYPDDLELNGRILALRRRGVDLTSLYWNPGDRLATTDEYLQGVVRFEPPLAQSGKHVEHDLGTHYNHLILDNATWQISCEVAMGLLALTQDTSLAKNTALVAALEAAKEKFVENMDTALGFSAQLFLLPEETFQSKLQLGMGYASFHKHTYISVRRAGSSRTVEIRFSSGHELCTGLLAHARQLGLTAEQVTAIERIRLRTSPLPAAEYDTEESMQTMWELINSRP